MSPNLDIEAVRSEALRKVGRNVVNFQKVEACLKFLVAVSNTAGTRTTIQETTRNEAARIRRESLGNLATSFHHHILDSNEEPTAPPDLSELWMSVSLKVEGDADSIAKRKRALSTLVKERNILIHHDLVRFDYNSIQSCRELIDLLDAQNPRILAQLSTLRELIDVVKSHIADVQAWVDSDDFVRQFESSPADA